MHGLRCAPGLLGWTRLLDEWIVGLGNLTAPCWEDPKATIDTLARAVTRVQTFDGRADDVPQVQPDARGVLQFELQGVSYRVSTAQCFSPSSEALHRDATKWRESPSSSEHSSNEVLARALFVTPRLAAADRERRLHLSRQFVQASRELPLTACAFSFPSEREYDRYHYANSVYPGGLVLVIAEGF